MHTPLSASRITLLGLACCTSLALLPSAHAYDLGTVLVGDQVPDWAVGDRYGCSGVLVTPRVMISAADCGYAKEYFHRKTGLSYAGKALSYPGANNVLGNVSVFISDGKFGGDAIIQTAAVASYKEQKTQLVDGNAELSSGARLEFYAWDRSGWLPGDRAHRQMRLISTFLDLDTYEREFSSGNVTAVPGGPPLFYRSAARYRQLEPDYLNSTLDYFYKLGGQGFNDEDADDAVIYTAGLADKRWEMYPPVINGKGAGLFVRPAEGEPLLVGSGFGGWAHVRLSHYWPWVVKTLESQGLREDALLLSKKVLGTGDWGDNDRKAEVGDIFAYENPHSNQLEYLRLVSPDASGRYGSFPINQKDNAHWEYLGTTLPDMQQATTPLKVWEYTVNGVVDAVAGTIYVYNNPYTRDVEYFRLNESRPYGYFPVNKTSNAHWTYLGTDLPTRALKHVAL